MYPERFLVSYVLLLITQIGVLWYVAFNIMYTFFNTVIFSSGIYLRDEEFQPSYFHTDQ